MSCPDWIELETARDTDPDSWERALEHLDDCPACRESAFDADPLLLFRGLEAEPLREDEVDEIAAGVATLRRARELEANTPPSRRTPALTAAAAAAAVVALLSGVPRMPAPEPATVLAAAPVPSLADEPSSALADLPILEDVGSDGSLVQVDGADFTLIFVERAPPSDA